MTYQELKDSITDDFWQKKKSFIVCVDVKTDEIIPVGIKPLETGGVA